MISVGPSATSWAALLAQIPRPRRPRYGPGAKLRHQAEDYTLAFDVGVTGDRALWAC